MVKLYLKKDKNKYIDISIWSLVKANFLSSLLMAILFYGGMAALIFFFILI